MQKRYELAEGDRTETKKDESLAVIRLRKLPGLPRVDARQLIGYARRNGGGSQSAVQLGIVGGQHGVHAGTGIPSGQVREVLLSDQQIPADAFGRGTAILFPSVRERGEHRRAQREENKKFCPL